MPQKKPANKETTLITEELFREAYQFEEIMKPPFKRVIAHKLKCTKSKCLSFFPIANWLSKYSIKKDLLGDIIAGVTVAVMHIPHGLAYAPLGRVEAVVGFYMAIFPVLIYMLLGTSRHISIGTFAVLCAMVGHIVMKYENPVEEFSTTNSSNVTSGNNTHNNTYNNTYNNTQGNTHTNIEIGATVCLFVGMWQAALGLLRLGTLTVIMSESLVSGFTAGAAVHVLSYQLKNLFGVNVAAFSGVLKLLHIYIDFFSKIKTVNLVTMSISFTTIGILLFFNEFLKPFIKKKFPKNKIPIPIELFIIILGILVSFFAKLSENYNVTVVGHIPQGFPKPFAPPITTFPYLIIDSLIVSLVALAINLSLAKIFANKNFYTISSNQELIAYGAANIFASFFQCLPSAASLSRSSIQFAVGGNTQLASLFSASLIIIILLFAGSLFEPVPYCVLSSIVVVTLKGLLMQIGDLCEIWKKNSWDGIVWLGTFISVIILDLDIGLGVGIILSVMSIIWRSYHFKVSILGRVPNTAIYLDMEHYKTAQPVPDILILQVTGDLNFTNSNRFENIIIDYFNMFSVSNEQTYLVLSMLSVSKIDPTSVESLKHLYHYLRKSKCDFYITDCNVNVYSVLQVCNFFKDFSKEQVLASVSDAVEYITSSQ